MFGYDKNMWGAEMSFPLTKELFDQNPPGFCEAIIYHNARQYIERSTGSPIRIFVPVEDDRFVEILP